MNIYIGATQYSIRRNYKSTYILVQLNTQSGVNNKSTYILVQLNTQSGVKNEHIYWCNSILNQE